jgi:hypothetical protein
MVIYRQDTNGTKPPLAPGELGYDKYPAGGDEGRVWVGKGDVNIPLAKNVHSGPTAPTGAATGDKWYNTANGVEYNYLNGVWVDTTGGIRLTN